MVQIKLFPKLQLFIKSNREYFKAFIALIFWTSIFYSIVFSPLFIKIVIDRTAFALSTVIEVILQSLGSEIERVGTIIKTTGFSMDITYKCTGVYQATGYLAAVLAYPTNLRNKIIGVIFGVCFISFINIIRILSIFFTGLYAPEWIPFFHGVFWEALMIILTITVWLLWVKIFLVTVRAHI